ncbi:MAG: hypothetical protein ABI589_09030 [Burkholderiales bacterium]
MAPAGDAPASRRVGVGKLLLGALVIAVLVGYPIVVHELIASGRWPGLTVLAGLLPAGLLLAVVAFNSRHRVAGLLVIGFACALAFVFRERLQASYQWIYLVQHVGTQLFLCWLFGHTLLGERQALITRLATRARGHLPPELLGYTRKVTLAWTVFFAVVALVSLLLFAFAPLSAWSLFANVLSMPLVALMFLAEYAIRRVSHRNLPHVSMTQSVKAFWNDQAEASPPVRQP